MERGERAAALAEELGASHVIADVTTTLTRLVARAGGANLDKARQRYNDLVATSRADGNIVGELRGLHNLAFVLYNAGELDDAEDVFRTAMARAETDRAGVGALRFRRQGFRRDHLLRPRTMGRGAGAVGGRS